ncbi:MAG: IS1595 family transposase [Sedimentisphaerales bacterium]|nr:IS1595 family transposase [Sedimentisphaerales bacterium]
MKKKNTKPGQTDNEVLKEIPLACIDETAATEFMEKQRWGEIPACPHCGDTDVVKVMGEDGKRNKRYLWRCHGCKKQFTVRIGTVFEDSRIPLRIWCYAFWKACSSKKGISALQISRECSITYKSALFLMHRIRYAMTEPKQKEKLQGTVEADETYVGGKPRHHQTKIEGIKRSIGRGTKKTPVFAIVERNGNVRTKVMKKITVETLKEELIKNVELSSRLNTDDFPLYRNIGKPFDGGHGIVNHKIKEYTRGEDNTNTVESFFALLKRGVYGTFHSVSKKHLHRYINEFAFRWNARKIDDGMRVQKAIRSADGKRLMYKEPISKTA